MWTILAFLAVGIIIGSLQIIPPNYKHWTNYLGLVSLIVMLVAMGAQIGGNKKLFAQLGNLGFKAFVLASMTIIGSVVLVRLGEKWQQRRSSCDKDNSNIAS